MNQRTPRHLPFLDLTHRWPRTSGGRATQAMPEREAAAVVGLTWAPKIPSLPTKPSEAPKASTSSGGSSVWVPDAKLVDGLFVPPRDPRKVNKLLRKSRKDTAGGSWFDMPAPIITPEIKKDLEILKLRSVVDPKRFYKKSDSKSKVLPKYFQMGTVIESTSDFYSSRLTNKERKATMADELLSDQSLKAYRKRKMKEIADSHQYAGHAKWKSKGTQMKRRGKQRKAIL